ncbi:MAG: ABC transporter substrate-binding protein [Pseudomonadota bacterium]
MTLRNLMATTLMASALALPALAPAHAQDKPDLVIAVDNLWPTMDPVVGLSTTGGRVHSNIFDTLVRRNRYEDPDGRTLVPWLAESWQQLSPNVWEFSIRDGVPFHDGHIMDAEDVAFSLSAERLWGEEPLAPRGTRFDRGFTRVEATGPLTIEIETSFPDPNLPFRLVTPIGFVLPKHFYDEVGTEAFGQLPMGTGPYRMTSFDPSVAVEAEAFADYWAGEPPAASLRFEIVPEFSTRFAGLVSGEYDVVVSVPADQVDALDGTDGVTVMEKGIENYPMFAFNMLETEALPDNPLTDVNLRRAIVAGVDREAIAEAIWGDATFVPTPFNFPEYGDYFDPDRARAVSYDPEQAAAYLEASDYDGQELLWHITRGFYPNYEIAAEFMVEQWAELGINVRIALKDNFSLAYERPFHFLNMSMSSEFSGDPYRPLWMDWGPVSSRVRAHHKTWAMTPEFEALGNAFEQAQGFDERYQAYLDLVAEWERVTPGMYMWRNVVSYAIDDGLQWDPGNSAVTIFDHLYMTGYDK